MNFITPRFARDYRDAGFGGGGIWQTGVVQCSQNLFSPIEAERGLYRSESGHWFDDYRFQDVQ